ncbi:MAG: mechanosensitive ion channel family protein [Bacteroidota bacterium]|nr:mechanosensitive ion channel family protein [Bacteroidota bacterium]
MFESKFFNQVIVTLLIIIASWIAGKLIKFLLNVFGKKILTKTKTTLDDKIIDVLRQNATLICVIIGIYIGLEHVSKISTPEEFMLNQILYYLQIAIFIIIVLAVARLISRLIEATFVWYMDEVSLKTQSNITATIAPLTNKIISIVIFLAGAMIILEHFGVSIGSLLVSLGVGSLAIALAAQDTLANMIAGFVIMIDRPYRIGDRIQLPSGETGDVTQIGLRSTHILNFDNNHVVVPNAEMIKSRLINYSYPQQAIRAFVDVGVKYGTDISKARKILLELADNHPDLMKDPPPEVFLIDFGQSAVILRLNMRTDDFKKKWFVETLIREQIYKAFSDAGITIPLTQHVVHMVSRDEVKTS